MDPDPGGLKTCGSRSGSPTLVLSLKLFANFDHFIGEECVHTAGEVSALPLYKRPGLASGLSPNSPGRVCKVPYIMSEQREPFNDSEHNCVKLIQCSASPGGDISLQLCPRCGLSVS
jgi:hypothetical protein